MYTTYNNRKKTIRVLLIMGDENSVFDTTYIQSLHGDKIYRGFNWDIWKEIQEKLEDKYNFEITESKITKNYDIYVNDVAEGKYDIAISGFTPLSTRQNVYFTIPHAITSNTVMYFKKFDLIEDFKRISITLLQIFIYLIVLGILIGLVLFFFDPDRKIHVNVIKKNNYLYFLRSILTGIATIFGEMGLLSERSSLKLSGITVTVLLMGISFILLMYFQAEITKILLINETNNINRYNIEKLNLIGHANNSDSIKLRQYGANVKEIKDLSSKELVEYYLENKDKYDGFILSYHEAYKYKKQYGELDYSADFGNESCSFIINKNERELYDDVNREIVNMIEELRINKICKSYFGDIENIPICSLI